MAQKYNLSLIFYPQINGGYGVVCPEIKGCFSEGDTIDEATANIRELIADFLPGEITSELDEQLFREGSCMTGKLFREIEASVNDSGEIDVSSLTSRVTAKAV
jgi:predicted RNase H-like HicB family nuclease